jgi:Na+/proline symporter
MALAPLDWTIVVGYFVVVLGVGLALARRAGSNIGEFFVSGRALPWWLAGTSMVATTFAADTPLAVTGLVAKDGLAGNWFWWAFALGGMFTVFVYARLWRRAEVLTDVELIELRYGGRPAAFLRGFRSLYVALLVNSIVIGWVTQAMVKVLKFTALGEHSDADDALVIGVMLAVVGLYSAASGMWGVAMTDLVQFVLAMGGCIALAVLAVDRVGGTDALREQVSAAFPDGAQAFAFLPDFGAAQPWLPLEIFLIMLFVQWWATWYPGAEPGGGGYIVQRMASCRTERDSLLATLWYQVAHYCVRPWPWLMVAFAALALHPELRRHPDPGVGFPMLIKELAPPGLYGLLLVAFFAAFMSTISTQMNWGASYLVNDVYKRFVEPRASDRRLMLVSRIASVVVLALGGIASWLMIRAGVSVDDAWKMLAALGAGTGAVFMLRWFWWRINAWSEIAAMVASLVFYWRLDDFVELPREEHKMAVVAGLTVLVWLVVTFVTRPESNVVLTAFYRKVRPGGPGWRPIAAQARDVRADRGLGLSVLAALAASGIVYCTLPGIGAVLFGEWGKALGCAAGAIACAVAVALLLRRIAARRR